MANLVTDPVTGQTLDLDKLTPVEHAIYATHIGQTRRAVAAGNRETESGDLTQTTSGLPSPDAAPGTGQTQSTDASNQVIDPITSQPLNLTTATPDEIATYREHQAQASRVAVYNPLRVVGNAITNAAGAAGAAASSGFDSVTDAVKKLAAGSGGGDIDTSPVSAAAASAKALSDKFLADYNAAHPGEPPVASAAQLPPAVLAAMPPAIKAGIAQAGAPVVAGQATASLVDPSTGAPFREGQLGLMSSLQDVLAGRGGPSLAELQLEQTRERNAANQLGLASKASGGGNAFLALQNAANQTGRINAQAGSDAAILRAKDIMDARTQLGNVTDQGRSGDFAIAGKNADLSTGVSQTNAGQTTAANSQTASLANAVALANANNETNANTATGNIVKDILQGNQKAANDTSIAQGGFTNSTNNANADREAAQRALDEKSKADLASAALTGSGQNITGTVGAAQAAAAAKAAQTQKDAAYAGVLGTVIGTLAPKK